MQTLTANPLSIVKADKRRIILAVLYIVTLVFLLPTEGSVEGAAASYWGGVRLRLLSGKFWLLALVSGVFVVLALVGLNILARYLARFVTPRPDDAQPPENNLKRQ